MTTYGCSGCKRRGCRVCAPTVEACRRARRRLLVAMIEQGEPVSADRFQMPRLLMAHRFGIPLDKHQGWRA